MSSEMTEGEIVRCVIEGTLITRSFLHIGGSEDAGTTTTPEGATVSPVVTGHNGQAIIPASALRGAIRSLLAKVGYEKEQIDSLMGKATTEEAGITDPGNARRVFVRTAIIKEDAPLPTVDVPNKCVDHISMTAINRWRRAPADGSSEKSEDAGRSGGMLRTVEAVPPGVTFSIWVGIAGNAKKPIVMDDEIVAVLKALEQFNEKQGLFSDASLGAFSQQGWGQMEWKELKVSGLKNETLIAWLGQPELDARGDQGWGLCKHIIDTGTLAKDSPECGAVSETFYIDLELKGQSTFLTSDTRRRSRRPDGASPEEPHSKVMQVDGKVYLSGNSIKGALRSQLERILRTCGIGCCDPTQDERGIRAGGDDSITWPRCKPIRTIEKGISLRTKKVEEGLCLACQIFGAGGWASTISVSPFKELSATKEKSREFIAISRFTGGGADGLKFSALTADRPTLQGRVKFDLKRLAVGGCMEAKLGALLHLFRDLAEGDIRFGSGASKGMGLFKVVVTGSAAKGDAVEKCEALLAALNKKENESIAASEGGDGSLMEWLEAFDKHPKATVARVNVPDLLWKMPIGLAEREERKHLAGSFNPYHWVPAVASPEGLCIPKNKFGQKSSHRHDRYARSGHSGAFTVEIQPKTPTFVGGKRPPHEGNPTTVVEPYMIDEKPAIPATSLRGLISSIYEMATGSAMRVLESDAIYSFRMEASHAFKYIGKVVKEGDEFAIIPWARTPETRGRQNLPNCATQQDDWEHIHVNTHGRDCVPNHYRLDNGKRDLPPLNQRHNEIHFKDTPIHSQQFQLKQEVIDRFHRLADDRTGASKKEILAGKDALPYEPIGQARGGKDHTYRLKEGDFVYFKADTNGVTDISLSQIWRSDVGETIGAKFGRIGPDIVPCHEGRKNITMAEAVFGFVSTAKVSTLQAYASKVSLTDAKLENDVPQPFQEECTLRILASPKPPSPAFYFEPSQNKTRLPKFTDIRPPNPPNPRGRKIYLHLKPSDDMPWKTTRTGADLGDQQSTVTCITKECRFRFQLTFDNLSATELYALCYSLQPIPGFLHKLGMGKPLGLGSVELKVVAVRATCRVDRYTLVGFGKPRFAKQWDNEDATQWTAARAKEWRSAAESNQLNNGLHKSLRALEIIGTTQVTTMQYPKLLAQTDNELKLFEWPSRNQKLVPDYGQFLRPIEPGSMEGRGGLLPLPSECHVIVVHPGPLPLAKGISEFAQTASSYQVVANELAARKAINSLAANSVIFVMGTWSSLTWVDSIRDKDVRPVKLTSLTQPPNGDAGRSARTALAKELKGIKGALELGATRAPVPVAVH